MAYLMDWVIQLITIIFIIMIIEMLVPQTSMKKYVNTILSLVFLLMFLQPVFQLFQIDIEQSINHTFNQFGQQTDHQQIENEIELKKKDIQATQSAYVIEELAIELENQVEGELRETYGVEISHINFDYQLETNQVMTNLEKIEVFLRTVDQTIGEVEEVIIGRDVQKNEQIEDPDTTRRDVETYLHQKWEVEADMLAVFWEG